MAMAIPVPRALPLAALLLLLSPFAASQTVTEPQTQIAFPTRQSFQNVASSSRLSLLGSGVAWTSVVRSYAVALYFSAGSSTVNNQRNKRPADIRKNQGFYDFLANTQTSKVYVMALNLDVSKRTLKSNLNARIGKTLSSLGEKNPSALTDPIVDRYSKDPIPRYVGIALKLNNMNSVEVAYIDDVRKGLGGQYGNNRINSQNLAKALGVFFLGTDPRSPTLKDNIAERVSRGV